MKMEEKIEQKLRVALRPSILNIENQSHLHAGHAGDDGSGESHFYLEIQSYELNDLTRVAAQRRIFDILNEEMQKIHALSIKVIPA